MQVRANIHKILVSHKIFTINSENFENVSKFCKINKDQILQELKKTVYS